MASPAATSCPAAPAVSQGPRDLVVRDGGLAVDEVVVILRVEDGDADVLAGEALDVRPRRPPADCHDFCPAVIEVFRPHLGTQVAGCLPVCTQAGKGDVLDVGGCPLGADPAPPCPGNHRLPAPFVMSLQDSCNRGATSRLGYLTPPGDERVHDNS